MSKILVVTTNEYEFQNIVVESRKPRNTYRMVRALTDILGYRQPTKYILARYPRYLPNDYQEIVNYAKHHNIAEVRQ